MKTAILDDHADGGIGSFLAVGVNVRGTELYNLFILSGISKFTTLMAPELWNVTSSCSSSREFIKARSESTLDILNLKINSEGL